MTSLEELQGKVKQFCEDRDWDQFHNPKELAIGMVTESAELLDIFRFKSEEQMKDMLSSEKREHIEEEMADVLFFMMRFASFYDVDLAAALEKKIAKNAAKYPVEKSKGSNLKYDE